MGREARVHLSFADSRQKNFFPHPFHPYDSGGLLERQVPMGRRMKAILARHRESCNCLSLCRVFVPGLFRHRCLRQPEFRDLVTPAPPHKAYSEPQFGKVADSIFRLPQ